MKSLLSRGYYGCNNFNSLGTSRHLRPFDYDSGAPIIERNVWMDNVESHVGKSSDTSDIRSIQLSCSQCQREE